MNQLINCENGRFTMDRRHNRLYESPETEVLMIGIEKSLLISGDMTSGNGGGVTSIHGGYGGMNDGVDPSELDGDGNWIW